MDDCVVIEDFFDQALLERLMRDLDRTGVRKLEEDPRNSILQSVRDAASVAGTRLGFDFDASVLKRYSLADDHVSGAYDAHADPEELRRLPLCLFTLKGEATLRYWDDAGSMQVVECHDNVAVVLRPDLVHQVTPPTNADGTRYLLFLGGRMAGQT